MVEPAPGADVRLRTLLVGDLPLLIASVPSAGPAGQLVDALADRGVPALTGFVGVDLPRGARVGFMIDASELRLVDDREQALLRAPREGLDQGWLEVARRLKGTMTVVVVDLDVGPETPRDDLVRLVDQAARGGSARGAIIGVAEERPVLPLLFG